MGHPNLQTLGADIRALRKTRGLTLSDLADVLDRSVGWLSQVERDISIPTIGDLRHMADALNVPVSILARSKPDRSDEEGYVVRHTARRSLGARVDGLVEELLSPDLTDDFEMVHSTFKPGSCVAGFVERPTQEVGYMVSGRLDLTIGQRSFTVSVGDSFRIRGEPFQWSNPYKESAVAIWVIAPPVY